MVGVVAAVGDQAADRAGPVQQGAGEADVVDVSGCQQQYAGPPLTIGQGVELARLAAAREAERLGIGPPFAPPAERWALMCVLSIIARPWIGLCPVKASKMPSHTPCRLQRLNRLYTVVYGP